MDWRKLIRDVSDFPKPGVTFKDITPLLKNPEEFRTVIQLLCECCLIEKADIIVGIEARGFIFASVVAYELGLPLVIIRKPGKLPHKTISQKYKLEYGEDMIELHKDSIERDSNVIIIDDVLATGGTALAACKIVKKLSIINPTVLTVMNLSFLEGDKKMKHNGFKSYSLYTIHE